VHIRDCDVANEDSLVELLADCAATLPPIRGVVVGSMVLDDTIMEHMKYEQWINAVRPKINGSRNLHKHLPRGLDFFIMLSSVLGVGGGPSQANYAAGNTYQDALARHRNVHGLPAVTIDLCVIRKVGYVESKVEGGDDNLINRVRALGVGEVDVSAVLRLLEAAIRNPFRVSPDESQVIMGVSENTVDSLVKNLNALRDLRFGTLRLANRRGGVSLANSSASNASSTVALVRALSAAGTTLEQASNLVTEAVLTKVAEMFNIPKSEIDLSMSLSKYGVDSLVAVELRNWISSIIKAKVSVFEIVQSPSLAEFGKLLAARSEYMSTKLASTDSESAEAAVNGSAASEAAA